MADKPIPGMTPGKASMAVKTVILAMLASGELTPVKVKEDEDPRFAPSTTDKEDTK